MVSIKTILPGINSEPVSDIQARMARMAQIRANTVNAMPGTLTGYECPECKNRGHIAVIRDENRLVSAECSCMDIRRCVWAMEKSGLKNVISRFRFEKFQTTEPWQADMKRMAVEYSQNPDGWLAMCGQSGCGKTTLCVAVCRKLLLEGRKILYMPWVSEAARLKMGEPGEREKRLQELKNAEILYIDDLWKCENDGTPTGADVRLAFELLNQRYLDNKATIISTEWMPEKMLRIDQATGGRILEMAGKNCFSVSPDMAKNYRLRMAQGV